MTVAVLYIDPKGPDADCAPRAVEQVHCGLPFPYPLATNYRELTDEHGGYTIEVDQVEWGHVARKRTWLYLVGVPREALEPPPFPGREPTHWCSGGGAGSGKVPPGMKVCSSQQRRRTPQLFAEMLIRLARAVKR